MDIPPVIERGIDDGNLGYGLDRDAARAAVLVLVEALERIASPNFGVGATGRDAHEMAAYARRALESVTTLE